ncbi:MAG: hypothetical protein MZV70_44335 [Desulfobacterales bacterium]|nr:hypothetical protein [Desulfobacterales bacterium]
MSPGSTLAVSWACAAVAVMKNKNAGGKILFSLLMGMMLLSLARLLGREMLLRQGSISSMYRRIRKADMVQSLSNAMMRHLKVFSARCLTGLWYRRTRQSVVRG